jgi:hypothetical protein
MLQDMLYLLNISYVDSSENHQCWCICTAAVNPFSLMMEAARTAAHQDAASHQAGETANSVDFSLICRSLPA